MDNVSAVRAARRILESVTPLNKNCGNICGAKCCQSSDAGDGMLLFPGEETLYPKKSKMFSISKIKEPFFSFYITCDGTCDRALRPLACRFFPLIPFAEEKNGKIISGIRLDRRAWPICPLNPSGITGLSRSFVDSAKEATSVLLSSEENLRYIINLTNLINTYQNFSEAGNSL
ncbi:MAG: hypothetical protein Q4E07_02360 [Eubacteriales bacterium]|nr:hypothetical protein [Eubacteriales bacterium]